MLFAEQTAESTKRIFATTQSALDEANKDNVDEKPYTLERFSIDFFLPPPKHTLSNTLLRGATRKKDFNHPWAFTWVRYYVCTALLPSILLIGSH